MRIVWDEPKRLANIDKHGYDFAVLTDEWLSALKARPAKGNRLMVTGELDGRTVVVIFARLGTEAVSIISMHAIDSERTRRIQ